MVDSENSVSAVIGYVFCCTGIQTLMTSHGHMLAAGLGRLLRRPVTVDKVIQHVTAHQVPAIFALLAYANQVRLEDILTAAFWQ